MNDSISRLSGYLTAEFKDRKIEYKPSLYPSIAMTSQAGSNEVLIASSLRERLQKSMSGGEGAPPWTFFGPDLIRKVLREGRLPESLGKYFPEDAKNPLQDLVEELVGLHPSTDDIRMRSHQMVVDLFRLGHAIVLGRGSAVLSQKMRQVLRVRLVGTLDKREERMMDSQRLSREEGRDLALEEDASHRPYAKECFGLSNLDEPVQYDLVLNTDSLTDDYIVDTIAKALVVKFDRSIKKTKPGRV